MLKKLLVFSLALAFVALSIDTTATAQNGTAPTISVVAIGQPLADFTLPDADGKQHSLKSLRGANGTVIIFVATKCPVSNAYNERMAKLAADFKARGVSVIGINSNKSEPAAEIKEHAATNNLSFPILKDDGNKIADRMGAQVTPEVYLLDAKGKLVYRGRIDNTRDAARVETNDLRDALTQMLDGKAIARSEARAFGCTIKRVAE